MVHRPSVDALEARELLATLPSSTFSPATVPISAVSGAGNMSSPSITVDQNNPQKLAAVWTRNDPQLAPGPTEIVEFAVSNDGGQSWLRQGTPGGFSFPQSYDPTTSNPVVLFPQYSDASIAFDRNDNFYILYSGHKADNSSGVLLLSKYNFSTGTPQAQFTNKEVYKWVQDPAFSPTLAVDDSVKTFNDIGYDGVNRSQSDPYSGNVYVSWVSADVAPAFGPSNYNPNRIRLVSSSDGGNSFSGILALNDNGNFGLNRPATPRLTVSQGSSARGVNPGQVTVVWDDWGVGSRANPQYDQIYSDRVTNGSVALSYTNNGGPIGDAGAGTPNSPTTTDFPIGVNVTDPRFLSVTGVTVNLALVHPSIGELQIVLIPPPGSGLSPIVLLNNQTDSGGGTNQAIGASGANLGITPSGEAIGTTFDDAATRNIVDLNNSGGRGAAAPFAGHFQAEGGSLNARYNGATASQINGTWTLRIIDNRNSNVGTLRFATLTFNSGFTSNVDTNVASTYVRAKESGGQVAAPAVNQGIGATPVVASDNTLGAYSPYQGRIYAAFIDRNRLVGNPPDNTDVYLAYSDDGGVNWTRSTLPVNDDYGPRDGYTEGSAGGNAGRSQFQPSIAVDSATGTLVLSWLDTRNDAARARVSTYLTTSIDGGLTFSTNVYANDSQTATDAITGQTVILGPIPDNQSGANGEAVAGFGTRQGLAVYGGHAYPIWSSNKNGGTDGKQPLGIRTNTMTFAAGPRVVNITQGPVGEKTDTLNVDRAADGTPIVSAFVVTFDRPVDPSSFSPSDVRVLYRDTTANNATGGFVPVSSVVPLNNGPYGATQYQVNFAPRSGVGTYSVQITAANIHDSIRTIQGVINPSGSTVTTASTDVPQTVTQNSTITSSIPVSSFPAGQVIAGLSVTLSINAADASSLTLTLISPSGTRIVLANHAPFPFAGGQNFTNTTFSDNATQSINSGFAPFTGTFLPVSPLGQLIGQGLNGTWRLEVQSSLSPLSSTLTGWSLSLQGGVVATGQVPGNKLDQNRDGKTGQANDFFATPAPLTTANGAFTGPFSVDSLPLIVPGPHVQSTSVPGAPASADNLVLDSSVSSIDVTFDRNMDPTTVTPASVLRVMGPAGPINGPFTIQKNPLGTDPDPLHPRTYRILFPPQKLSGTYTVTLASTITDARGNALDTNLNAGVDLLRGVVTGPTSTVTYNAPTPAPIADGRTVVSTIDVPDNFLAQGVTVQLNITHANDPDLQITLVSPNNTPIVLVARGTGSTGTHANFQNTIFDDAAATLIANGGPPFFGRFKPNSPLSALNGQQAGGTWKLIVDDNPASLNGVGGQLVNWSLSFQKGSPASGLGESVADQSTVSFRIFNSSATNPLSSTTWTSVGPASTVQGGTSATNNGYAGRVPAVAVDPSDPSGNTVYVAGASGGVWKTTNFLTTDPKGPTYIPLTDFGPNSGLNIGSLAVFPRNNDPRQSIIIAGTGDGNSTFGFGGNAAKGVGFLRSLDGGATWQLLDSTNNNLPFAGRDHRFTSASTMKVVVDPRPTPSGGVIVYAAMKSTANDNSGGLWRSTDTGLTWQKMSADSLGDATDVVLDNFSATVDAVNNPTGNVNIIYAAFPGSGVYISPNRGQVLNRMAGGTVDPLIYDATFGDPHAVPVTNGANAPNGAPGGRIVLARPAVLPTTAAGSSTQNVLYEGWLYAAVADASGHLDGLYLTKDYGQTWTKLKLSTVPDGGRVPRLIDPSNDPTKPDYDVLGSQVFAHGNYDLTLAVDPTNPNIAYLGGTANGNQSGLIRVDATRVYDSHSVVAYDGSRPDGGLLQVNTTGRTPVRDNTLTPSEFIGTSGSFAFFGRGPYLNLIQDPTQPFRTDATVFVNNVGSFTNDGSGVRYTPIDEMLKSNAGDLVPSSNMHSVVTMVDPITGRTRLIFGNDQGVFTGVLNPDGTLNTGIGNAVSPTYSRNGNLSINQFYYGAAGSSSLAAQVAQALFYGSGLNSGLVSSDPNVLNNGNTVWQGSTNGARLGFNGVTSGDQATTGVGVGYVRDTSPSNTLGYNAILYQFVWPDQGYGGNKTDFFQVSTGGAFVSRTSGLVQGANDTQWSVGGLNYPNGLTFGNFTVNPLVGDQVIISSNQGRIFSTTNAGQFWLSIGEPGSLDGSYAPALTYGAPDPNGPAGVGNLNNFIYAGTVNGNVFVTQTGGGGNGNAWTRVSTGLDGSPVVKIIADPTRGSHDAYAVTQKGVYYIADSTVAGASWTNITGNLFSNTISPFGNASFSQAALTFLTSIQADWRYVIPNDPSNPAAGTHPVLYVSGNAGVYRSVDNGVTWTEFPNQSFDNAPTDGGYLPNVQVNDLTMSLGQIDPTTGRPNAKPGDPNVLLASTFGRGQFMIRLAPLVFPTTLALDPRLPLPSGSASGGTDPQGRPIVKVAQPVIDGLSEQTAFGNTVRITILDLTDPNNPRVIGGYNPALGAVNNPTDVPANYTDSAGRFQVQVYPTGFTTKGVKTIGIQATDSSGTQGNVATMTFVLDATLISNTAPASPELALNPADDTSNGGKVTRVTNPRINGTTDPAVTVQLFLKSVNGVPQNTPLGTTTSDALGNFSFQFPTSPDGVYAVQAVATNPANSLSTTGSLYTFTIKTTAPTIKPVLSLSPADDTGAKGDNITAVRMPNFVGQTDPFAKVSIYKATPAGVLIPPLLATATADANGKFAVQLPFALSNGTITVAVSVADAAGNQGPTSGPLTVTIVSVDADYTDAGKTTPALFRRAGNGGGYWFIQGVTNSTGIQFGGSTVDVPFAGDFDGDGKADLALYRPGTNTWFINRTTLGFETFDLGQPGTTPAVGDFDGDGKTDTAAYDAATGTWTISTTSNGLQTVKFNDPAVFTPRPGDVPVPGNYNGGIAADQLAVYRPSTGQFFIKSVSGDAMSILVVPGWKPGSVPVPGNYDDSASRRKTEAAVYDPGTGTFSILGPNGAYTVTFSPGDIPAPGDYGGVGRTQAAVYHLDTATGVNSFVVGNPATQTFMFGGNGDIPVTAPLVYRNIVGSVPTIGLDPASDTGVKGDNTTSVRRPFFAGKTEPNALIDLLDGNNNVLGSGAADSNGNYRIQISPNADLPNGTYSVRARARGIASPQGPVSAPVKVRLVTTGGDYNGDGTTDPALFRRLSASDAQFFVQGPSVLNGRHFGSGTLDVPIAADVDGDGKTDLLVFRPSTAQWFVQRASTGYQSELFANFGSPNNGDIPVPADYLGIGRDVLALFRPATGQWFIGGQAGATVVVPGRADDIPVPADYDNVGRAEFAVYRPSTGQWVIQGPNGAYSVFFGGNGDVPVPGNYDGTGAEPAMWRPSTGQFFIRTPGGGTRIVQFAVGDVPAPGDYNGDGVTEAAVYRPSTGQFYAAGPGQSPQLVANFGGRGDIPIAAPYAYRAASGAISVSGVKAASVDFGSTARSMSTGSTPAPTPAAPTAPLAPAPRLRPRQAFALSHPAFAARLNLLSLLAATKGRKPPVG